MDLPSPTEPRPRDWFVQWSEPDDFLAAADESLNIFFVADRTPDQYLRDAYVAGRFARIWQDSRGSCSVRLVPAQEDFPDAQLSTSDSRINLEITLAPKKGKRMFEEWRQGRAKAERGEIVLSDTTEERQENARYAIPEAVKRKACKHYAEVERITLLVYTDDGASISADEMVELTKPWKDRFGAIYVLSGMDAVMVWPDRCILRGKEPLNR